MSRTQFEELDVYRLSENLADSIWLIAEKWQHFARNTVGTQLVRAADSIGANIAEGSGRGSFKDNAYLNSIGRTNSRSATLPRTSKPLSAKPKSKTN
jgi:hypothetical protein